MMTGFSSERIFQALEILDSQARGEKRSIEIVRDYETDCVSDKVVRIIQSYTDFVNRKVWKLH
jgi:UDP-N-acetylglucosamine 2-epimerase (non-hydrolysing)